MLDIKYVLAHFDEVRAGLSRRGVVPALDELEALDKERRSAIGEAERLKAERNEASKKIGELVKAGGDAAAARERVRAIADRIKELDERTKQIDAQLEEIMLRVPNIPHASAPDGLDDKSNRVERVWGTKPSFDFPVRDHVDLGEIGGILDFQRAAKITGARFCVLSGLGARLERALVNFMLDLHVARHRHQY